MRVLLIVLLLGATTATAKTTIRVQVNGSLKTHGYTSEQVIAALEKSFLYYSRVGNLDIKFVQSGGDVYLRTNTLHLGNGVHARGWVIGKQIELHSGWVPAHTQRQGIAKWWKAFSNEQAITSIFAHELGHAVFFGRAHSGDTRCLMHINAGASELCGSEKSRIVSRYGPYVPPPPPKTYSYQNPKNKYDVNNDGKVTSRDALYVVNRIGVQIDPTVKPSEYPDVNDDGKITSQDALLVINQLGRMRQPVGDSDGQTNSDEVPCDNSSGCSCWVP